MKKLHFAISLLSVNQLRKISLVQNQIDSPRCDGPFGYYGLTVWFKERKFVLMLVPFAPKRKSIKVISFFNVIDLLHSGLSCSLLTQVDGG